MAENQGDAHRDAKQASKVASAPRKELTPAAQRALAEADERRKVAETQASLTQPEVGGRDGPDPVRYGDWEKGGIISDF